MKGFILQWGAATLTSLSGTNTFEPRTSHARRSAIEAAKGGHMMDRGVRQSVVPVLAALALGLMILGGIRSAATAGALPGKVTGGGSVAPGLTCDGSLSSSSCALMVIESASPATSVGGKATFGFTVQCCPTKGNLVYHDHVQDVDIKAVSITGSSIDCPFADFQGTAKVNGQMQSFKVHTFDGGEPGSAPTVGPDMFSIETSGGYFASGELIGGNIQCHQ